MATLQNSDSDRYISPDIWKKPNPDPDTSETPKDTNPNLELDKEHADEAWNLAKERASKN
jgi:hypothetical protein